MILDLVQLQSRVRLNDVCLDYFSFRLESLQVALVCLLYVSLNLIGQQDSQIHIYKDFSLKLN